MNVINVALVGLGGALGALCRFAIGKTTRLKTLRFCYPTFLVNISGALALGLVSAWFEPTSYLYLLLGEGFLGAYTTFSTFMFESTGLFRNHRILDALAYIIITVITGLAAYRIGYICGGLY